LVQHSVTIIFIKVKKSLSFSSQDQLQEEEEEEVGKQETEYTDPVLDMEGCRAGWESVWGSRMGRFGGFKDTSKHAAYLTQLIILLN
jgi:hypothetical protein